VYNVLRLSVRMTLERKRIEARKGRRMYLAREQRAGLRSKTSTLIRRGNKY
jgi:hypothetical protein